MQHHPLIRRTGAALAVAATLTLAGCANTSPQQLVEEINHAQHNQAGYDNLVSTLAALEQRLAAAKEQQLSDYAPEQMQDARDANRKARALFDEFKLTPEKASQSHSLFSSTSYRQKTQEHIDDAIRALAHAERIKQEADTVLAESFEFLAILEKLAAPQAFSYQYRELKRDHDKLVAAIADGDIADAREALPELLKQQRALEIAAAQHFYLHELTVRLKNHRQSQLDRDAPISMEAAVAILNRAGTLIATDPREQTVIGQAVADARFAIEVAESVAAEVQKLRALDRDQLERVVLDFTSRLNRVGTALNQRDVRNLPLNDQVVAMVAAATSRQQELAKLEATLETQQQHWQQQLNEQKLAIAAQKLELMRQQLTAASQEGTQNSAQASKPAIRSGNESPQADVSKPASSETQAAEPAISTSQIAPAGETAVVTVQPAAATDANSASRQEGGDPLTTSATGS